MLRLDEILAYLYRDQEVKPGFGINNYTVDDVPLHLGGRYDIERAYADMNWSGPGEKPLLKDVLDAIAAAEAWHAARRAMEAKAAAVLEEIGWPTISPGKVDKIGLLVSEIVRVAKGQGAKFDAVTVAEAEAIAEKIAASKGG